jgi:LysR family glycine cleavage system transcriptional activator
MESRLPSLNALLAFEAAARHGSFTLAARELHVTQSAISHQVRTLEEELGLRLFERLGRTLRPTRPGRRLARAADEGLSIIRRAVAELQPGQRRTLVVSVLPSFAAQWLLPRLHRFQQEHPHIELKLDSTQRLADLQAGEADLAIRYGPGRYRGLVHARLFGESLFPVCTPALAGKVQKPEDLGRFTLLHDEPTAAHGGWSAWLREVGIRADTRRGPTFSDTHLLLRAALEGQGIALARSVLVEQELAAGRLVRPFRQTVRSRFHYSVVYARAQQQRVEVQQFSDFLLREAGRSR